MAIIQVPLSKEIKDIVKTMSIKFFASLWQMKVTC